MKILESAHLIGQAINTSQRGNPLTLLDQAATCGVQDVDRFFGTLSKGIGHRRTGRHDQLFIPEMCCSPVERVINLPCTGTGARHDISTPIPKKKSSSGFGLP
ncbi:hypothetical protein [Streptomyces sp. NPDC017086]|uniref:hypothetical protein n=1 Tax=unclassified Streptomyces TaxID=2593676 RepID=UPI00379FAD37